MIWAGVALGLLGCFAVLMAWAWRASDLPEEEAEPIPDRMAEEEAGIVAEVRLAAAPSLRSEMELFTP
jgi:hypothetical protein